MMIVKAPENSGAFFVPGPTPLIPSPKERGGQTIYYFSILILTY